MRFENLLTRSARIVWRRPWLWLLALLAGETYGAAGPSGSSLPRTGGGTVSTSPSAAPAAPDIGWLPAWLADRAGLFLELAALALVLGLLLFLLSCVAEGALIGAAAGLDAGEQVSFGGSLRLGTGAFWRVLGFKLVQALLSLLGLLVLLIAPLAGAFAGGSSGFVKGLLLDLPVLVLTLAWLFFVGVLALLGLRACVLDGRGPIASFAAAWDLLRRRFNRVALTWLVFVAVGIGLGILLQLVLGLVWVPFSGPVVDALSQGRWSDALTAGLVAVAVILPVSLVLSAAAGAYVATGWTVAYRRFAAPGEIPEPPPLAA